MSSTSRSLWLKIVAVKLKHDLVQQPAGGARGLHMLHRPEDLQCKIVRFAMVFVFWCVR